MNETFHKKIQNNKQRKIMLTAGREKMTIERERRGDIYYIICQELSFLVAICCRILRVARQRCVCLSALSDNIGMKFCTSSAVPTRSGSIRWISADLKNLCHVFPLFHNLVCHRPSPYKFRFRLRHFLCPDSALVLRSCTLPCIIISVSPFSAIGSTWDIYLKNNIHFCYELRYMTVQLTTYSATCSFNINNVSCITKTNHSHSQQTHRLLRNIYQYICIYNNKCWLVGDHLLLKDFGPYWIIFMNVCVLLALPWYGDHLLLRVFGVYRIIL
jgi:hypothetical protein